MTEQEFWDELEKHKGEFRLTEDGRIRTESDCPLSLVLKTSIARQSIYAALGSEKYAAWGWRVMNAADSRGIEPEIRARLCEVLGLVE